MACIASERKSNSMSGYKGMKMTKNPTPTLERYFVDDNGCWNYTGYIGEKGYGHAQGMNAHRYFYMHFVGEVPAGLQIDHLCRNRRCVNPEHLEPVTAQENSRRRSAALTHCRQGHEFTSENTVLSNRGWRFCRICAREADRRLDRAERLAGFQITYRDSKGVRRIRYFKSAERRDAGLEAMRNNPLVTVIEQEARA